MAFRLINVCGLFFWSGAVIVVVVSAVVVVETF
jgi:hypothetical protein